MATNSRFERSRITTGNVAFSPSRTTIETAFYGNNVRKVIELEEAYEMAKHAMGTIVTDMPVFDPQKIGLPESANVLLFNDGETVGRFAGARIILGEKDISEPEYASILREAAYGTRYKKMIHTEAYIGLDEDFMVKANLLVPETYENTVYNWLLNFQSLNEHYNEMYQRSAKLGEEPDIFILSDPDWKDPRYPNGIAYFDPEHNCAALLGLRYFGEHKKGTLTIAWGVANRNGYASCHGGLKRMIRKDEKKHVMGVFGLSGSGKSTLTHAKHDGKYEVTVLHDDAYVISTENGSSVALEPSYFDKTQDYPLTSPDNKYLVTVQNCGATIDCDGKLVIVTEDLRNGNGRAIKSKLWAENRVDKLDEPINSIVWLMKDHSLPPVIKIENPVLASVMGAVLATKRTTAEKLADGVDKDALVFEPYANPFRTYPLEEDYNKFKALFKQRGVECFIINTGHFLDKKIPKEVTIGIIESIVDETAEFVSFGNLNDMKMLVIPGFEPDFGNKEYMDLLVKSMNNRVTYLDSLIDFKGGRDNLPEEAKLAIQRLIQQLK
ncbi:phosphoenolpyruvate carboxykinase (ATP) [Sinanaerobacter chloroacetimidivorans]|uniref:phosphoenolpyruvate carboxykinase (ATP) n=1 Tax=Sinanaerobacter chloroacetimidivorans TaxID=2818044 RepID=A0A8J7VZ57_9FIRM|nr:phosphoenolpyruvate carboxykinase (ATP) [Sinanaerobacter chloroacetimidivorans]MBR0597827.1 phosphoenolpyruvate carboxykinase (ATP) [Sinanaerobacter chloroacetimidivorans]